MAKSKTSNLTWIDSGSDKEGMKFLTPEPDKKLIARLAIPPVFGKNCQRVCSRTIDLLPSSSVPGHTGIGYHMINVDGFRYINAYVISEALNSTTQRGFSLGISFSVNNFVIGLGVVGETNYFFNFDNYYNTIDSDKKIIKVGTSDLTSTGSLVRIGGVDYTHLLRVPVMGPFIRASVFNNDDKERKVLVKGYLTT